MIRSSEYGNDGQDPTRASIIKCTRGIVFLGTPHTGVPESNYASMLGQIMQLNGQPHNKHSLGTLQSDSQYLERLRRSFASVTKDMKLYCIFAEKASAIGLISVSLYRYRFYDTVIRS